ncbi:MAG: hypothetical protein JSV66_12750 [Trueperaceae bacterium]|nr:MAG: hypothetical protein JSV66_12750 [Trueperaceae bacterium]
MNKNTVIIRDTERTLITQPEDLPDFSTMTAEQEADWWEKHDIAPDLLVSSPSVRAEVYQALGRSDPAKKRA